MSSSSAAAASSASESSEASSESWLSGKYKRWRAQNQSMPPSRQKELIVEYVAQLDELPHQCLRETQAGLLGEQRDKKVHLAPSSVIPSLTAVYLNDDSRTLQPRARVLDYSGWILTEAEYQLFGYAVHSAVHLPRLFGDASTHYVLVGDPTRPGAQLNCVTGTGKRPNCQLTLNPSQLKITADTEMPTFVADGFITVRATKTLHAKDELFIDYGHNYWETMSLYCPWCYEYGGEEEDKMLLCDVKGCKRAWHQLCLNPGLLEVPDGAYYCDVHRKHA